MALHCFLDGFTAWYSLYISEIKMVSSFQSTKFKLDFHLLQLHGQIGSLIKLCLVLFKLVGTFIMNDNVILYSK